MKARDNMLYWHGVVCWAICATLIFFVIFNLIALLCSGCTPHAAHKIWDGYEIRDGWEQDKETQP